MEKYVPDSYYKNIFEINYKKLKEEGISLLLFDLDNTLAPFNKIECEIEVKELFDKLKEEGMKVIIFSNSPRRRLEKFKEQLNVDFVSSANKPLSQKFLSTLKKEHKKESETVMIGDQLITDIQGGNKVGIYTILVDPISDYDPFWTKILRKREKKIKSILRKKGLFKGRYYEEKV